ncbi:MAG: hypothetical protein M3Q15_01975 [Pseudomonadota bacterium]|nr:hypothetical protein [Pseudomonadota bacterium]
MTLILKDPDAVVDYAVDWGADYLNGDALASSAWQVAPDEPDGVAVADHYFDASVATVKASGGIAGRVYRLSNVVEMESGRKDARSFVLRVEAR